MRVNTSRSVGNVIKKHDLCKETELTVKQRVNAHSVSTAVESVQLSGSKFNCCIKLFIPNNNNSNNTETTPPVSLHS